MPRSAQLIALFALAGVLSGATPVPAPVVGVDPGLETRRWVIPPGREQVIQDILKPVSFDGEVAEGWVLTGIDLKGEEVALTLRKAGEAELRTLTLRHPQNSEGGKPAGPGFSIFPAADDAVVMALVAALSAEAGEAFWQSAVPGVPELLDEKGTLVPQSDVAGSESAAPPELRRETGGAGEVADLWWPGAVVVVTLLVLNHLRLKRREGAG